MSEVPRKITTVEVFLRFAKREYLDEYLNFMDRRYLKCNRTGKYRELRTRVPERDLEVSDSSGRNSMVVARFFAEVWKACDYLEYSWHVRWM